MIRIATLDDMDFAYELYMHPAINPFLLYEQMDLPAFVPIYQDLLNKGIKFIYIENNLPTGMFKLAPYTYRNAQIVYLGGLAIHPARTGTGLGKIMMQEIIAFAGERGFLRIELSVAVTNQKAINLYERSGFKKEGTLEKYTFLKKEQKYMDEFLMAYLF